MGNFGEDLRMERISRGIALEEISAVTKISQRHLMALEQERFRQLPGGILNKGIVRGYAGAIGLDENDWTERFMTAYRASGQVVDDDRGWAAFAANVGKARMMRRDQVELRIRWVGAILLMLAVGAAAVYTIRYYGLRTGWWLNSKPVEEIRSAADAVRAHAQAIWGAVARHVEGWYRALLDAI